MPLVFVEFGQAFAGLERCLQRSSGVRDLN
jgi:hypothetical protein